MQSQQPGFRSNLPARVCRVRGSTGVNCPMRYLSEWNAFNPYDRETYPKVNAPVQVTYEGGRVGEGFSLDFFPASGLLSGSLITRWRYIKQEDLP